jgi:4-hydroxy-2-oxovalerate/4-hydroxy-2-oxohexanoate aldolase
MTTMNLRGTPVTLHDMSLRDGMHPKRHQISLDQMIRVSTALDEAGMPLIEVTHGDGLGGASINYGFALHTDEEYLRAVIPRMKHAKVSALLLPGIGTIDDLRMAVDCGVGTVRVATHCTEADVAGQHIGLARKLGVDTVGFLMMAHMIEPAALLAQAKLMESYGANCVYALILGYAGVYSSFLLFAKRASERYGVPSRDILVELGRRKTVGGQEDMIEDLALDMAKEQRGR